MQRVLPRDWPELRHDRPHCGQAVLDHLRLCRVHRRVRGELLSMMLSPFYSQPRCCRCGTVRHRTRAAMAGVELTPRRLLLF